MRWCRRGFALSFATFASACSGGGSATTPPAVPVPGASTTAAPGKVVPTASVSFEISIPKAPDSTERRPHYLSSGTQSMQISTNGAVTATPNLTATSPGCSAVTGGLQCVVMANAPVGDDTFTVVTFDAPNATGHVLSQGTVGSTIVMGTDNPVLLTLEGVVASVAISSPTIPTCTATSVPLTVNGVDAAGYTIVGALPYVTPITLSLQNAKNSTATTLTGTTTIAKPGQTSAVTYDGGYEPGSTITATSGSAVSTYVFFPKPAVCNQYAVVTPTYPHVDGIATGSDGNLYVGAYNLHEMLRISPTGATIGVGVPVPITAGPAIVPVMGVGAPVAPPAYSAAPLQAVTGPDKNLWIADGTNAIDEVGVPAVAVQNNYGANVFQEDAVGVGPDSRLWFTDIRGTDVEAITTAGVLTEYPLTGGVGRDPEGIVAGPDGAMWLTEDSDVTATPGIIGRLTTDGKSYTEYPVPVPAGGSSRPQDIVVGGDGNLWFDDRSLDAIVRLTTSGTFTVFPIPDGASGIVYGMTTGPDGNIWFVGDDVANGGYVGRVVTQPGFGVAVGSLIQCPIPNTTDLTGPFQITVTPDDNLWFTETYGGANGDGQVGYLVI